MLKERLESIKNLLASYNRYDATREILDLAYDYDLEDYVENIIEESMINEAKLAKRKMIVHLEKEKDNKYNDFISSLEEEVKLSNQELDGQLEIPGVSKIKRR